jgi:signal transduction histidine kinase
MKRERGRRAPRPRSDPSAAPQADPRLSQNGAGMAGEVRVDPRLAHLAAAMAHEVRNPLNSIALHAELLEGKVRGLSDPEREAVLRSVQALQGEVQRIDRILGQYLKHVGPPEGERRQVELSRLLDEAAARARPLAEQRGVKVEVEPCPGERWSIDAEAIQCALDQVLGNAVEAYLTRKCSTSSGMSLGRSRSGGSLIVTTLMRK